MSKECLSVVVNVANLDDVFSNMHTPQFSIGTVTILCTICTVDAAYTNVYGLFIATQRRVEAPLGKTHELMMT